MKIQSIPNKPNPNKPPKLYNKHIGDVVRLVDYSIGPNMSDETIPPVEDADFLLIIRQEGSRTDLYNLNKNTISIANSSIRCNPYGSAELVTGEGEFTFHVKP